MFRIFILWSISEVVSRSLHKLELPSFPCHWPVESSWIEPSPRSSPPCVPSSSDLFSFPSHCSPFWPGVPLNGVGSLKPNITSATLSPVPDTGSGSRPCGPRLTHLCMSAEMSCFDSMSVLKPCYGGWGEAWLLHFSLPATLADAQPSTVSLILFKAWNWTVVLPSGHEHAVVTLDTKEHECTAS